MQQFESADSDLSPWDQAPEVVCDHAQVAFDEHASSMGLRPQHPWVGGYVAYEWAHLRHIARALPVEMRGLRVLEFGCNIGASAILHAQFGARVSAIDIRDDVIELARLNARRYGREDIDFRCVPDTRDMPFPEATFDLVVCNSVLEYVEPAWLSAVQREIDRVLAPGGLILVTGSGNRLWPHEVHSGRWLSNYLPRAFDQWRGRSTARGLWPWQVRHGFGRHYDNLDVPGREGYFWRSRRSMGVPGVPLVALQALSMLTRVPPGLLAPSVSCLLRKRG